MHRWQFPLVKWAVTTEFHNHPEAQQSPPRCVTLSNALTASCAERRSRNSSKKPPQTVLQTASICAQPLPRFAVNTRPAECPYCAATDHHLSKKKNSNHPPVSVSISISRSHYFHRGDPFALNWLILSVGFETRGKGEKKKIRCYYCHYFDPSDRLREKVHRIKRMFGCDETARVTNWAPGALNNKLCMSGSILWWFNIAKLFKQKCIAVGRRNSLAKRIWASICHTICSIHAKIKRKFSREMSTCIRKSR